MFEEWKAAQAARQFARAEREAKTLKVANDAYLRRIKNSAECLTGTTHSGTGCDDVLDPYEIRSILRRELARLVDEFEVSSHG